MSDELKFTEIEGHSNEELLLELGSRFPNWVFIAERYDRDNEDGPHFYEWSGDQGMCACLCGYMQKQIDWYEDEADDE